MEINQENEKNIKNREDEERNIELMKSIIRAKRNLEMAGNNYNYAEGELIDYYAYQIKAEQSKLNYLLKKVKNKELALDMIEEIELRLSEYRAI